VARKDSEGLHYVCHDIALRLCALTVMNQSKKVARGGGAWHGGAIRTEQIMGKAEARAGIDEDAARRTRGNGRRRT
jgi:hypothetical protein